MHESKPATADETPVRRAFHLTLRFAPLALVIVALAFVVHSGALKHLSLEELRASRGVLTAYVRSHPFLSLLAYVGAYIVAVGLSIPGAPLVLTLAGGFLFGPVPGSVAATIGVTLGGCIAFLVARLAVGDSLEKGVGPRIRALEEGFKKDAFFYLMTLRLLPVMPFWVVNVAAGLLSIRLSTFFLATLVGIFPVGVVYAGLGSGLGRMFDRGLRPDLHSLITPELILPLAGLAVLSVLPILYHQWRGRRAAAAAFVADDAGVQ